MLGGRPDCDGCACRIAGCSCFRDCCRFKSRLRRIIRRDKLSLFTSRGGDTSHQPVPSTGFFVRTNRMAPVHNRVMKLQGRRGAPAPTDWDFVSFASLRVPLRTFAPRYLSSRRIFLGAKKARATTQRKNGSSAAPRFNGGAAWKSKRN